MRRELGEGWILDELRVIANMLVRAGEGPKYNTFFSFD